MNVININIDFTKGICEKNGISVVTGDFNSTKLVFNFVEEYEGTKIFELRHINSEIPTYVGEIINDEVVLVGTKEEEGQTIIYSLFDQVGDYVFEVSLYQNDSKLTSMFGYITARQEQVVIGDEIVEPYMPIFDTLILEINTKLDEMDSAIQSVANLDVDAEKVDDTTTITITKQDGTQETTEINDGIDGISLQYNWNGTNLGIKREDEQNYEYVNLKGDKGDAGSIKIIIVNELPLVGEDDTIYLMPYEDAEQGNIYKEYIYINGTWEELGSIPVEVDLSDYYTKSEVNNLLPTKLSDLSDDSTHRVVTDTQITTWNSKVGTTDYATENVAGVVKKGIYGFGVNSSGIAFAENVSYGTYQSKQNTYFISKGTLENVITGKGLVSNTDYATLNTGGVIKVNSTNNAVNVNQDGNLYVDVLNYSQYQSKGSYSFIGKGTLENVITGKDLTTKSYVDSLVGDINTALDTIQGEII